MNSNDIKTIATAAEGKYQTSKNQLGKYFMLSILAGAFIGIGGIFSNVLAASFTSVPVAGKLLSAVVFPLGLLLIFFIGGELFTGNVAVMSIQAFTEKGAGLKVLRVLLISFIGNFVGSILTALLFVYSGAAKAPILEYFSSQAYMAKLTMPIPEMFLRAVFCNLVVCLCVMMNFRLKSEAAKVLMTVLGIGMFVYVGFEHCVANMSLFTMTAVLDSTPIALIAKNMLIVTLGNIVGGSLLVAWPMVVIGKDPVTADNKGKVSGKEVLRQREQH